MGPSGARLHGVVGQRSPYGKWRSEVSPLSVPRFVWPGAPAWVPETGAVFRDRNEPQRSEAPQWGFRPLTLVSGPESGPRFGDPDWVGFWIRVPAPVCGATGWSRPVSPTAAGVEGALFVVEGRLRGGRGRVGPVLFFSAWNWNASGIRPGSLDSAGVCIPSPAGEGRMVPMILLKTYDSIHLNDSRLDSKQDPPVSTRRGGWSPARGKPS
jgi:hypothetical protein